MNRGTTLIERLLARYQRDLQTFFRRRVPAHSDVDDLTQELYLRMLRVRDSELRNPEAYLYTVASNLLQEHAQSQRRRAAMVDVADPATVAMLVEFSRLDSETDQALRVRRLREVLAQLSPSCQAAVIMTYRHELSQEEIAAQLGVSVSMVKKHLKQALAHCRKRMARWS